jgi:hypothetical protein
LASSVLWQLRHLASRIGKTSSAKVFFGPASAPEKEAEEAPRAREQDGGEMRGFLHLEMRVWIWVPLGTVGELSSI